MNRISVSNKILLELVFSFFLHLGEFLAWNNVLWQYVPQSNCKLHENVLSLSRKGALVWFDGQILLVLPFHWCAVTLHEKPTNMQRCGTVHTGRTQALNSNNPSLLCMHTCIYFSKLCTSNLQGQYKRAKALLNTSPYFIYHLQSMKYSLAASSPS